MYSMSVSFVKIASWIMERFLNSLLWEATGAVSDLGDVFG